MLFIGCFLDGIPLVSFALYVLYFSNFTFAMHVVYGVAKDLNSSVADVLHLAFIKCYVWEEQV